MMIAQPRPLLEVLAEMPDFRRSRGKRHPLSAMLAMACCAVLGGGVKVERLAGFAARRFPHRAPQTGRTTFAVSGFPD